MRINTPGEEIVGNLFYRVENTAGHRFEDSDAGQKSEAMGKKEVCCAVHCPGVADVMV